MFFLTCALNFKCYLMDLVNFMQLLRVALVSCLYDLGMMIRRWAPVGILVFVDSQQFRDLIFIPSTLFSKFLVLGLNEIIEFGN